MFKIVRWLRRNPRLSLEQFRGRWLSEIGEMTASRNPIHKLVLSFSTGEVALGGTDAPFDVMVAGYFDRFEQLTSILSGPAARELQPGGDTLVDTFVAPLQIIAEETLMAERDGAEGALSNSGQLKVVRTVFKRRDLTNAQFKQYWLDNHSRLKGNAIGSPGVKRIVATFAIPQDEPPAIDGMVEIYFEGIEHVRKMFAGAVPGVMRKDEENFVQMDAPAVRVVTEEFVIRG